LKQIFVGNLDFHATEDSIRSRGFAFVEMAESNADKAVAASNGVNVGGHAIKVKEARPKAQRGVAVSARAAVANPKVDARSGQAGNGA
jgi:RNA recognition motif-containing protein